MNVGGLLSTSATENPRFWNWTMVFVHYCDGSSFTSYREDPLSPVAGLASAPGAPSQIWMRGRANLEAVVSWLLQYEGMSSAKEVILSGGSAGATATYIGADAVRKMIPSTIRLSAAPDAGFFLVRVWLRAV